MEYVSCGDIANFNLAIVGKIGEDVVKICCDGDVANAPALPLSSSPRETLERFMGMRQALLSHGMRGDRTKAIVCDGCGRYRRGEYHVSPLITYVNLGIYPSPCQCRCVYCTADKTFEDSPAVREGYERVFNLLEYGLKAGAFHPQAFWQISSGEITIHPYRERLMAIMSNKNGMFATNGFIYREEIGKILHENPGAHLQISIDSGTAASWKKVKGVDNFGEVVENLRRYHKMCTHPGQIMIKYIILPGINDTEEDFTQLVGLMKELDAPNLQVSYNFFAEHRGIDLMKLLMSAAYLVAICHANGIYADARLYNHEHFLAIRELAGWFLQRREALYAFKVRPRK